MARASGLFDPSLGLCHTLSTVKTHGYYLVFYRSLRHLYVHCITYLFAYQCPSNGRLNGNPSFLRVSFIGTDLKLTIALLVIIVVLLVKPSGLFGQAVVRRV